MALTPIKVDFTARDITRHKKGVLVINLLSPNSKSPFTLYLLELNSAYYIFLFPAGHQQRVLEKHCKTAKERKDLSFQWIQAAFQESRQHLPLLLWSSQLSKGVLLASFFTTSSLFTHFPGKGISFQLPFVGSEFQGQLHPLLRRLNLNLAAPPLRFHIPFLFTFSQL